MNRIILIKSVSEKTQIPQAKVEACLNAILESVNEALNNGDKVTLNRFGTFYVKDYAERKVMIPKTKELTLIKAKSVAKFKPTTGFIKQKK